MSCDGKSVVAQWHSWIAFLRNFRKGTNLLARYFCWKNYAGHFNTSLISSLLNWRNSSQTTQFCQGKGGGGLLEGLGVNVIVSYFDKCKLVLTCVVKLKSNLTVDWKPVDLFRLGGCNRRKVFRYLSGRDDCVYNFEAYLRYVCEQDTCAVIEKGKN